MLKESCMPNIRFRTSILKRIQPYEKCYEDWCLSAHNTSKRYSLSENTGIIQIFSDLPKARRKAQLMWCKAAHLRADCGEKEQNSYHWCFQAHPNPFIKKSGSSAAFCIILEN